MYIPTLNENMRMVRSYFHIIPSHLTCRLQSRVATLWPYSALMLLHITFFLETRHYCLLG